MSALDRPCPKCGCSGHEIQYERLSADREQLRLICRRCGYQQSVPTLDAKAEAPE